MTCELCTKQTEPISILENMCLYAAAISICNFIDWPWEKLEIILRCWLIRIFTSHFFIV